MFGNFSLKIAVFDDGVVCNDKNSKCDFLNDDCTCRVFPLEKECRPLKLHTDEDGETHKFWKCAKRYEQTNGKILDT